MNNHALTLERGWLCDGGTRVVSLHRIYFAEELLICLICDCSSPQVVR